jgi:hypothetical protein
VVFLHPEVRQTVSMASAYLISAGQSIDFQVSARVYEDEPLLPGGWIDARGVVPILGLKEPAGWAYDLPTTRSAAEIMRGAVQHGEDNPTHGTDCVCMDNLIRELRAQITSSIPAYTEDMDNQPEMRDHRYKALSRVKYLMMAAGRNL